MSTEDKNLQSKADLRRRFQQANRQYLTAAVNEKIVTFLRATVPAQTLIGVYAALSDEPNLESFLKEKERAPWLAYPRVEGTQLRFYVPSADTRWEAGGLGVQEPAIQNSRLVPVAELGAILVPAVAFDRRGQRLGRGKGYYDRALQGYTGLKIGVGSFAQIAESDLPTDSHDVSMDLIVTDRFVLRRFDT